MAGGALADQLDYLDKLPPIIDREIFFGDPEITGGRISPDGQHISFLKTYKGQLNIWVKDVDEPFDAARPMSADTTRPVFRYFWTQDGKYIFYIQDKGGNENFHAYVIDPTEKPKAGMDVPEARDLTPIEGVRVYFYSFPEKTPDIVYIGLNDRDERYHDLYRLTISTGERDLVWENTQELSGFEFDLDGNLRMATRETDDGGTEFLRIEGKELIPVYSVTNEESANIIRFHKDGDWAYMSTNKGDENDLTMLVKFDPMTGKTEKIESDPENEVDFGGAMFSEVTEDLIGTTYTGARTRIYWRDKKWEKAYNDVKKKLKDKIGDGDLYLGSSTSDDRYHIVAVTSDTNPGLAYLYDMETGDLEFLYNPRPNLPNEYLANMKPIQYKSRDGLTIHGYLTVPKNIKPKNLPVIVNPHGGPWARDFWGYNPEAQFFANRGYACLQVNFRSSTGYGKAFFNAGKKQWGENIQNDITDGVKWLIKEGIADPNKVAIYGGSFGGYSTLAGLAFTPDVYCCGVDYVGVCNLVTLLKSIPPYWETARKFFNEQVGDPDNPEDVARMKRQSPLFSADKIEKPLLVVQGGNDPRCKMPESQQIVIAMRDLGRDVEYLVAENEGHGFANRENRVALRVAMEKFFAKHLGGRYQEDVPEDIQATLDEMTVPVETVVLTQPEGDMETAKTAPLPAVDTANLKPAKMTYTGKAAVAGQEIDLEMIIDLVQAKRGDRGVWRIIGEQKSMMGSATDTFDVDQKTLMPVYRGVKQAGTTVRLNYSDKAIDGMITMPGREMPLKSELEAPVYGSDTALDLVIASLPLAEGYKCSFRTFDLLSQAVKVMTLEVKGVEEVTVPAGTFKTFKVELKNMDGEPGGGTIFVDTNKPRCVVRSEMELPPMMGGGTVTSELQSLE